MSSFVVSARKYRPSRFEEVVGQGHIVQTLKNAIRNEKLAHSFLFCGPRGVGKTTCARILAQTINCQNLTEDTSPCGECQNCQSFQNNSSFNVHELDAASHNGVDSIRELNDQVRIPPPTGKYKIYIIDEVHMLSTSAFNAFLKTLEEPPPYAIFILATTEKHKIIPTILSRCQIFDFKRIQVPDIVPHLAKICAAEGKTYEEEGLHLIAQKADGALRDALSIFDRILSYAGDEIKYSDVIENLNLLDYDYFFKMTEAFLAEDAAGVLNLFDEVMRKGFEGDTCIAGLAEHFRSLLVSKDKETVELLEWSGQLKERYHQQAKLVPASFLVNALNIANQCDLDYGKSKNKRLHVEIALLKLAYLHRGLAGAGQQATVASAATPKKKPDTLSQAPSEAAAKPAPPPAPLPKAEPKPTKDLPIEETAAQQPQQAPPIEKTPAQVKPIESVASQQEVPAPLNEQPTPVQKEPKQEAPREEAREVKTAPKAAGSMAGDFAMPSLDQLEAEVKAGKGTRKQAAVKASKTETTTVGVAQKFDLDDVQKVWNNFAKGLSATKMAVSKIVESARLGQPEDGMLEVTVENPIQQQLIKEELPDFRGKLLEAGMHVHSIEMVSRPQQEAKNDIPYTSAERLKKMEEKKPEIRQLRDTLGLELEF